MVDITNQLERITTFTTLGIRFWDAATDSQISAGLVVQTWPATRPDAVTTAFRTASGIYAFQGLPGLRAIEYPVDDTAVPIISVGTQRFIVQVEDQQQRFLATIFSVDLPLPYNGVFTLGTVASLAENNYGRFYLFSAPTRTVAPGLAAIRAQLIVDKDINQPAAHAAIEIQISDQPPIFGVADENGTVVILHPYPAFINSPGASPPQGLLFAQQQWPLTVSVRYQPAAQTILPGTTIPELSSIFNQLPANIWPTEDDQPVLNQTFDLIFGQELVMQTTPHSTLWVSPVTSPP